jgi:hypothetical protein
MMLSQSQHALGGAGNRRGEVRNASQDASPRSPELPTTGDTSIESIAIIEKVLERLKLSQREQRAWGAVKKGAELQAKGGRDASNASDALGVQGLREEIKSLAAIVRKLADASQAQSWAQVAAPTRAVAVMPACREREVLVIRGSETKV